MKRKKIAVFIGGVTQNFSSRLCRTISRKAEELGYDVFYFATFNSYDDNLLYLDGEKLLYSLPVFSELDGVIIVPDTLYINGSKEYLAQKFTTGSFPVVSIRDRMEGAYNVIVNEDTAMEGMLRHFIEKHGFKDICFMTGRLDMEDAVKRFSCYKRIMKEYNLPVTDGMFYYGDYWKKKGDAAVAHFLEERGGKCPQAIVCSNDYMALSVIGALQERGFRVPEDCCVSGYDNVPESKHCLPSITTLDVPFEKMAERAMDVIDAVNRGESPEQTQYIDVEERFRGSCGCSEHEVPCDWFSMEQEIEEKREIIYQTTFMNADLEGVTDSNTLFQNANKYDCGKGLRRSWIVFCDETEEMTEEDLNIGGVRREFTNQMVLRSVKDENGAVRLMKLPFDRSEIVPEAERGGIENGSFYITILHYKNRLIGYVVSNYLNYGTYNDMMQPWSMVFSVAIEHYRLNKHLNAMEDIKRLYKEDTLTGIYNRRGFEEQARQIYTDAGKIKKRVAVISIDMDNLKKINDAFGHSAGDDALCRVAVALQNVSDENTAYARTGGDEFSALRMIDKAGEGSDFTMRLREELARINERSNPAYEAEVSCGVYEVKDTTKTSLLRAMQMSDEHMYEDKRRRKALRRE